MKKVLEAVLTRVTVAHSLPGRVRVRVPAIAHVPESAPVEEYTQAIIAAVRGIRSVRVSRETATLLIEYEASVPESQIVNLVQSVTELLVTNAERFAALEAAAQERLGERVRRYLSSTELDPACEVTLPHDIWRER